MATNTKVVCVERDSDAAQNFYDEENFPQMDNTSSPSHPIQQHGLHVVTKKGIQVATTELEGWVREATMDELFRARAKNIVGIQSTYSNTVGHGTTFRFTFRVREGVDLSEAFQSLMNLLVEVVSVMGLTEPVSQPVRKKEAKDKYRRLLLLRFNRRLLGAARNPEFRRAVRDIDGVQNFRIQDVDSESTGKFTLSLKVSPDIEDIDAVGSEVNTLLTKINQEWMDARTHKMVIPEKLFNSCRSMVKLMNKLPGVAYLRWDPDDAKKTHFTLTVGLTYPGVDRVMIDGQIKKLLEDKYEEHLQFMESVPPPTLMDFCESTNHVNATRIPTMGACIGSAIKGPKKSQKQLKKEQKEQKEQKAVTAANSTRD